MGYTICDKWGDCRPIRLIVADIHEEPKIGQEFTPHWWVCDPFESAISQQELNMYANNHVSRQMAYATRHDLPRVDKERLQRSAGPRQMAHSTAPLYAALAAVTITAVHVPAMPIFVKGVN